MYLAHFMQQSREIDSTDLELEFLQIQSGTGRKSYVIRERNLLDTKNVFPISSFYYLDQFLKLKLTRFSFCTLIVTLVIGGLKTIPMLYISILHISCEDIYVWLSISKNLTHGSRLFVLLRFTVVYVPVKQPYRIWVNESHESSENYNVTTIKQSNTKYAHISW